jgi:hypothetical protein
MARSIANAALSTPDNSLPNRSQGMAKADMRSSVSVGDLSGVLKDSARRVYGKQGAAAATVGQAESNFSRDLETIARKLEPLGPEYLADLGKGLVETYAPLSTPAGRARELARRQEAIAAELRQLAEYIA